MSPELRAFLDQMTDEPIRVQIEIAVAVQEKIVEDPRDPTIGFQAMEIRLNRQRESINRLLARLQAQQSQITKLRRELATTQTNLDIASNIIAGRVDAAERIAAEANEVRR